MAGHGAERVEHARVLDAALDQMPLDHPVAGRRGLDRRWSLAALAGSVPAALS